MTVTSSNKQKLPLIFGAITFAVSIIFLVWAWVFFGGPPWDDGCMGGLAFFGMWTIAIFLMSPFAVLSTVLGVIQLAKKKSVMYVMLGFGLTLSAVIVMIVMMSLV